MWTWRFALRDGCRNIESWVRNGKKPVTGNGENDIKSFLYDNHFHIEKAESVVTEDLVEEETLDLSSVLTAQLLVITSWIFLLLERPHDLI